MTDGVEWAECEGCGEQYLPVYVEGGLCEGCR